MVVATQFGSGRVEEVLRPGDMIWVAPESALYVTWEDDDDEDSILYVEDWQLALVISTDHVKAQVGQHPWFLVLFNDSLRWAPRHNLMTMATTSTLKAHDLIDICAVLPGCDESPGNLVRHVNDDRSRGMVISCEAENEDAKYDCSTVHRQQQVTVLWSCEPKFKVDVAVQPIKAQSRKLNATWSPQPTSWSQEIHGEFHDPGKHDKELEQDIIFGHVSMKEAMDRDRDIKDIVMHHDVSGGPMRLEFKRWSHEKKREPIFDDGWSRIKRGSW